MHPEETPLPTMIGKYKVVERIATGGMGEIYLVYDSSCDRSVALKKIRGDRLKYPTLKDRFLREAKIAAQMAHPSIIPIYSIHSDSDEIYYTMPYVEGQTLKQILRTSLEEEKKGQVHHPIGASIPALMRIFLNICQAIAYCHNRGILHRDVKPENVIVGKFGETFILDWGLADFVNNPSSEGSEKFPTLECVDLTRPGKIPGTLAYIPPERILGKPASFATDIYALGVILYQLLTLRLPFHRTSDKKLKKQIEKEELIDPLDRAPYRDIPLELSRIAKKCLCPNPDARYSSVEKLLEDLENYIAGRGQWIFLEPLDINHKPDWEFQENILVAKHRALTRNADLLEWVTIMLSKKGFSGHFKMETTVKLGKQSQGIGFLLNVPEVEERKGLLEDSHCIWIGSKEDPGCALFRSNVQVLSAAEICLMQDIAYTIRIERIESHLRLYIDDKPALDYLTHIPLNGPHFGLMLKDADLTIEPIKVYVSSPNIMINCLRVPDTFLSNKNFSKALAEYRKISTSFPGRAEGREALFRAGITLVEEATECRPSSKKNQILLQALEEFGKLRSTPGAPFEYLGKSLVYKASGEIEEEIKCLELSLRKYLKHPLRYLIEEEVIFRLHESSCQNRKTAYQFALIALRHMPHIFIEPQHKALLNSLQDHWQPLYFIEEIENANEQELYAQISIQLSFWLAKPITLVEIIESVAHPALISNALFCLLKLGCTSFAEESLHFLKNDPLRHQRLSLLLQYKKKDINITQLLEKLEGAEQALLYVIEENIAPGKVDPLLSFIPKLLAKPLLENELFEVYYIVCLMLKDHFEEATARLSTSSHSEPWENYLQGCKIARESGAQEALYYWLEHPSFFVFNSYFVEKEGNLSSKDCQTLFFFEEIELLRLMMIFAYCAKMPVESKKWLQLLHKKQKYASTLYSYS